MNEWIETASGKRFRIDEPIFDVEDMLIALPRLPRFCGHTSHIYTVGEHSILVARLMEYLKLGDPKEGILHDAGECYLSDIASPWKMRLPDYKRLEEQIERPLRMQFGLPETKSAGCKTADWVALLVEAHWLMPSRGENWYAPPEARRLADLHLSRFKPACYSEATGRFFLRRAFEEYGIV